MEEEIAKYKKRKPSNTSKANQKSKHKHSYKPCLIMYPVNNRKYVEILSYCTICGKIGNNITPERKTTSSNNRFQTLFATEEIIEKNKDLSLFELDNMFQKYVELDKKL